jgi:hypothetical protein
MMRRRRHNPFYAKPAQFHGGVTRGVETHPGFHTACDMIITQPYAQMKVLEYLPSSIENLNDPIPDYPVILELDMHGLDFVPDYDALHWFNDAVNGIIEHIKSFDELESHIEYGDGDEYEKPEAMIEGLFYLSGQQPSSAIYRLRDWLKEQDDPEEAFVKLKQTGVPGELLAKVSCQYRYLNDVPSGRVQRVHYVCPVFDRLFPHYEDNEWEEEGLDEQLELIEAAGYDVVTMGNIVDDQQVLKIVSSFDVGYQLFKAKSARIEFHGTSLRNLLSAAPELAGVLRWPPKPFSVDAVVED